MSRANRKPEEDAPTSSGSAEIQIELAHGVSHVAGSGEPVGLSSPEHLSKSPQRALAGKVTHQDRAALPVRSAVLGQGNSYWCMHNISPVSHKITLLYVTGFNC